MSTPSDQTGRPAEPIRPSLIIYPRLKDLHRDIQHCQEMSKLNDEPQCMSLEGVSGAGKSTLIRCYANAFPRHETETGALIPVYYVETPSPATVKSLAATMLDRLGDPAAHHGTLWAMTSRLTKLLVACQVELVILDDFHHLIDRETNRVLETVSDWLKALIKKTAVPFLVVGIEGKVERILQSNDQLSRLFAVRETLAPFQWDGPDGPGTREFGQFILFAEKAVGLPLPTELGRLDLLYRLFYATDGVIANLMNLLRFAAVLARDQGRDRLETPILKLAFDKRLAKHLRGKTNPFDATIEGTFVPPQAPAHESGHPHTRRRKPWQAVGNVLTTQ